MKRADLQAMADAAISDAELLLRHGRFANAYYLAGYAVEFALKACIAKQIQAETVPDRALINDFWVHDLNKLVKLAGLTRPLEERISTSRDFDANWAVVSDWSPNARYDAKDGLSAKELLFAIGDHWSGVLPWIKAYW